MAHDKTVWMIVGADLDNSSLQIEDHKVDRVHSLGPIVDVGSLTNDPFKLITIRTKRQLVKLRPILRPNVLSIMICAEIPEPLISPVLL